MCVVNSYIEEFERNYYKITKKLEVKKFWLKQFYLKLLEEWSKKKKIKDYYLKNFNEIGTLG